MGGGYWRTLLMIHNWWGGKLNQKERLFRDFLLSDQFYPRRSEIYAAFYWSNSTWINLSTAVRSSSFRGIKVHLLILHVHTVYIVLPCCATLYFYSSSRPNRPKHQPTRAELHVLVDMKWTCIKAKWAFQEGISQRSAVKEDSLSWKTALTAGVGTVYILTMNLFVI